MNVTDAQWVMFLYVVGVTGVAWLCRLLSGPVRVWEWFGLTLMSAGYLQFIFWANGR